MLRNRKIKRNWNSEDITLLVWLVCKRLEQQALAHHSQLVPPPSFRKTKTGSLSPPSSQAPRPRSASSDGSASKR